MLVYYNIIMVMMGGGGCRSVVDAHLKALWHACDDGKPKIPRPGHNGRQRGRCVREEKEAGC